MGRVWSTFVLFLEDMVEISAGMETFPGGRGDGLLSLGGKEAETVRT